jgi:uncharacterized membrane protein YbhN (UPF0104 family)
MGPLSNEFDRNSWWFQLGSFLLAVVLLGLLIQLANFRSILAVLGTVDWWWYLLGLVLFMCSYVAATWRWMKLSGSIGYDIGFRVGFEIVAISYSLNLLLPANAGDLARSKVVEQYHEIETQTEVFSLVVLLRLMDLLVAVGLFSLASLSLGLSFVSTRGEVTGLVLAVSILAVSYIFSTRTSVPRHWLPEAARTPLKIGIDTIRRVTGRTLLEVAILTVANWLFLGLGFIALSHAITASVGLAVALLTVIGLSLMAILPLTPGGLGVGDTVAVTLLIGVGLEQSVAVVLALLFRSFSILWAGPLGIVLYLNRFPFSRT